MSEQNKSVRIESRLYSYNKTWIANTTVDGKNEHLRQNWWSLDYQRFRRRLSKKKRWSIIL